MLRDQQLDLIGGEAKKEHKEPHKRTLIDVLPRFGDNDGDKPRIGIQMFVLAVHRTLYRLLITFWWRWNL
jgi:hypothetical protein